MAEESPLDQLVFGAASPSFDEADDCVVEELFDGMRSLGGGWGVAEFGEGRDDLVFDFSHSAYAFVMLAASLI